MLVIFTYIYIIYLMRGRSSLEHNQFLVSQYFYKLRLLGINPSNPNLDEITRVLILQGIANINTGRPRVYKSQDFSPNTRFNEYGLSVITSRALSDVRGLNSIGLTLTFTGSVRRSTIGGGAAYASPKFIAFQYNMRHRVPVNGIVNH